LRFSTFRVPAGLNRILPVQRDRVSECLGRGAASVYRFAPIGLAREGPRPKPRIAAQHAEARK
jgi:hypothetical protein